MPKMKTNSSAKKRFKVTGTGKLKRSHAGKRHNLRKKTKKAKNSSFLTVLWVLGGYYKILYLLF